jgi:hypothetical protein
MTRHANRPSGHPVGRRWPRHDDPVTMTTRGSPPSRGAPRVRA